MRNFCFDKRISKINFPDAPVISIGNLTTGGTGKTPLVIWLCRTLSAKGLKCAILTRGYKGAEGRLADEPAMMAKACPGTEVIVNSDRSSGAKKAISTYGAQALIMDDGFQHRRLGRDIDIIAVDATCPFGYGKILPAGLLREKLSAAKRAHAAVITRYDQVDEEAIDVVEQKLKQLNPKIIVAKAAHTHPFAKLIDGGKLTIDELKQKKIYAFCGIGNPDAFLHRLADSGYNVVGSKVYNDHHNYKESDINNIYEQAKELSAEVIISTEKDWVKTALFAKHGHDIPFGYLALELEFDQGKEKIEALVEKAINTWKVDHLK